jgi:hypothetical protein
MALDSLALHGIGLVHPNKAFNFFDEVWHSSSNLAASECLLSKLMQHKTGPKCYARGSIGKIRSGKSGEVCYKTLVQTILMTVRRMRTCLKMQALFGCKEGFP